MSNNNRRSNRSGPTSRGGLRRSNTPPPPTVRLGLDGNPVPDSGPISTSRLRDELPKAIPVLNDPPADIIAAAARVQAEKAPQPPAPPPPPPPEPGPEPEPPVSERETLPSQPDPSAALAKIEASPPARKSVAPGKRRGNTRRGSSRTSDEYTASPPTVRDSEPPQEEEEETASPPKVSPSDAPARSRREEEDVPARGLDLDHNFFDSGGSSDDPDLDAHDEKWEQKMRPEVQARRAKAAPYVAAVGGVCLLLAVVGLVRHRTSADAIPETSAVAAEPPRAAPAKVEPAAPAPTATAPEPAAPASAAAAAASAEIPDIPEPPPAASGATVNADELGAKEDTLKNHGTGAPAAAGAAAAAPAADVSEADKKSAAQEKHACQTLLDQGAFAKAIEAGERSVALDPADGEAWLMLGAAYQSIGKGAEARRSFASCVSEAKRGPVGECRSMLR